MEIRADELEAEQSYKLITGIVVPRPVAWVSTVSLSGVVNLAPFSAFTFVSPKPPMLAISMGRKGGVYKDSAQNIMATEQFVVNIPDATLVEPLHHSAVEFPPDVSEVEALGLTTLPSQLVAPPRLEAAPISMECRLRHCIEFGETRSRLMVGEVLLFHIRDGLVRNGKIDTAELNPIARLAGPNYGTLGSIITLAPIHQTPK